MNEKLPRFKDFGHELLTAADTVFKRCPFDEFDMSKVFTYLVAELLESTDPGVFFYTDGGRDLGIDFYIQSGQSYHIYQCKSVEPEKLQSANTPPVFDADSVNQLLEAVDFLRDRKNLFHAKEDVRDLRTKYQRDLTENPEETRLYATLVVLGQLTAAGRERFESKQEALARYGITLRLVTWVELFNALHALDPIPVKDTKIHLHVHDPEKDIMQQKDWILGLIFVRDLVQAFETYGVRLFDMNVRNEIKGSKINRAIVDNLKTARGRKNFHHFNNGLLVVCRNYVLPKRPGEPIVVHEPQVVNGCQTVTSLWRAYKDLVPTDQQHLLDTVKVQVKIIQNTPQELIDDIVITTNNQNPMKPRNLKSNTAEQKDIQKSFRTSLGEKWFYVRKDGEFESLSQLGRQVQWFRKADYEIKTLGGRPRHRVVDNETVAKAWYSFIGFSGEAMMSGVDYFGNDNTYQRVFRMRPNVDYWNQFAGEVFDKPSEDLFEHLSPTAQQFLLALAVDSFIRTSNPSPQRNRNDSIARLVKLKVLKGNPQTGETTASTTEIAKALAGDQDYLRMMYLYNMENVLTELSAFLLTHRYGALTPDVASSLLRMPDLQAWCSRGFTFSPDDEAIYAAEGALLRPLYEFLRWAIGQNYFAREKYEIEASPRPKAYLARRSSITAMRSILLQSDQLTLGSSFPWKKRQNISFLASLANLPRL